MSALLSHLGLLLDAEPSVLTYAQQVLLDSPIGYWRLGESSGTTAANEVSANPAGTYTGTVSLGEDSLIGSDPTNTAIEVNGAGYISIGDSTSYIQNRSFSVEFVLETTATTGSLASHGHNTWYLRLNGDGTIEFLKSQNVSIGSGSTPVNTGDPAHVVLTIGSGSTATWELFVNGELDATGSISVDFSFSRAMLFGAEDPGTFMIDAKFDELAFYNSALSSGRIAAHYAAM